MVRSTTLDNFLVGEYFSESIEEGTRQCIPRNARIMTPAFLWNGKEYLLLRGLGAKASLKPELDKRTCDRRVTNGGEQISNSRTRLTVAYPRGT